MQWGQTFGRLPPRVYATLHRPDTVSCNHIQPSIVCRLFTIIACMQLAARMGLDPDSYVRLELNRFIVGSLQHAVLIGRCKLQQKSKILTLILGG